jgi:hypothetical protein
MMAKRRWSPGHPALLLLGSVLALSGLLILLGLAATLYDERWSARLVSLGIPGALLSELVGLTAAVVGGAIIAAAWVRRR